MNLEKKDNNSMMIKYQNTDNVVEDICSIIESARDYAYQSVNIALVERNWFIGYRIAEEELKGENRADYGTEILKKLSKELKKEYGKGFELRNLYYFLQFYKTFPNILHSANAKSNILLSWTHYKTLLQVPDEKAREWYEKETAEQTWSVRTLQRNISSQYYYRLLKSQVKEPVIEEMKEKNKEHYLMDKLEFVKNPLIAEFLGFSLEDNYTETELETSYSVLHGNEQLFATKYKTYLPNDIKFVDGTNKENKNIDFSIENLFSEEDRNNIGINNEDYSVEKAYYSLELLKKVENAEYQYSDETIKNFDKIMKSWLN